MTAMKEQPAHPGGRGNPPPPQPDQVRPTAGGGERPGMDGNGRGGGRPPSRRSCAELEESVREGNGGHGRPRGGSAGGKREPREAVSGMRRSRPEGTQPGPDPHRGWDVAQPGPGGSGPAVVCAPLPRELRRGKRRDAAPAAGSGGGTAGAAGARRPCGALRIAFRSARGGQGAAPQAGELSRGDFGSGRAAVTSLGPTVPPRGLAGLRLAGC